MEIHHHPDLHHKSKNFREYFLEFLMIFLAVTMGFFAENIKENISNNEHAKLLSEQLIKDLKKDTSNLQFIINSNLVQQKTIDTLFFALQKSIDSAGLKEIQQLVYECYTVQSFQASTGAMEAIEKELNIKQFANCKLPAMLADYQQSIQGEDINAHELLKLVTENIQSFIYQHFTPINAYNVFSKNSLVTENKMRNLTQQDMAEFSIKIENINALISAVLFWDNQIYKQAVNMMQYVTTQYHLENA